MEKISFMFARIHAISVVDEFATVELLNGTLCTVDAIVLPERDGRRTFISLDSPDERFSLSVDYEE